MLLQIFHSMEKNRSGLRLVQEEKGTFLAENVFFSLNNYCPTRFKSISTGRIQFSKFGYSIVTDIFTKRPTRRKPFLPIREWKYGTEIKSH